jgi:Ras GTPase-activating protein-binding protein 1
MRRFMQTFVLAPRQPKKYYVQNDIFRYQDEVFDEGSDEDDRSSSHIYGDTDKVSNADSSAAVTQQPLLVTAPSRPPIEEQQQHQPLPPRTTGQTSGGNQPQVIPNQTVRQQEVTLNGVNESTGYNGQQETIQENQQQAKQTTAGAATEGTSYAGIAKLHSSSGPTSTVNSFATPVPTPPLPQQPNAVRPTNVKATTNRTNNQQRGGGGGGGNYYQQNNRGNQWTDNSQQDQSPARRSGANVAPVPNEQQVFVGSLPLEFTKEDLIECFSQYGNILDAKIHMPAHDNKKNFGFVIFDDPAIATKIVKMEHITHNSVRLNVEPKTQRSYSGNNNNGQQGNGRNNNYQGRGGRGGNRGPYRGNGNNQRRGGGHFGNNSPSFNTGDENYKPQQQQPQQQQQ